MKSTTAPKQQYIKCTKKSEVDVSYSVTLHTLADYISGRGLGLLVKQPRLATTPLLINTDVFINATHGLYLRILYLESYTHNPRICYGACVKPANAYHKYRKTL